MGKVLDAIARFFDMATTWLLAAMALLVFGNVVLRYGFNTGITVSEELSRILFIWLIFLGAASGVRRQEHMAVDYLVLRLSPGARRVCAAVANAVVLVCAGVLAWGSFVLVRVNAGTTSAVLEVPLSLVHGAGLVAGATMVLMALAAMLRPGHLRDPAVTDGAGAGDGGAGR